MTKPIGWTKGRLGETCSIEIGGTPSRNVADYWDGSKETSNLWVSIKDLNQRIITETAEHISDLGINHSNVKLLAAGTILLSFKLTIGRVAIAGCPLYTNEAIAGLRSSEIDHEYLFYGLQQWDLLQGVDQAIKGATLNKEKLRKIEFDYPTDKREQTKIAEVLALLDRAIEETDAVIAKQQRINYGLMQDLLVRGIDEAGNLRTEETHEFKDSPLGKIPVDWTVTALSRCVNDDSPICYGILMPGIGYDNGVPVVKVRDIVGGEIVQDNILLTDPKIDKQYKRSRLHYNDLLITIRGTTGRIAVVPPELNGANITQDTARIRLSESHSTMFFYFLLQSKIVQDQVSLHTIGQAVKGINIGDVKKISLALPRKEEQQAIAERLKGARTDLLSTCGQLKKLSALKVGLMQDLLTGERRVTAPLEPELKSARVYA